MFDKWLYTKQTKPGAFPLPVCELSYPKFLQIRYDLSIKVEAKHLMLKSYSES